MAVTVRDLMASSHFRGFSDEDKIATLSKVDSDFDALSKHKNGDLRLKTLRELESMFPLAETPSGTEEPGFFSLENLAVPGGATVGSLVGSLGSRAATSLIPPPAGPIVSAALPVLGAIMGGGTAERGRQFLESERTGQPVSPNVGIESLSTGLQEGVPEVAGIPAGRLAQRGMDALLPRIQRLAGLTPGGKEAAQFSRSVLDDQIPIAQITNSRLFDVANNLAEGGIFGGQPGRAIQKLERNLTQFAVDQGELFGNFIPPQELGTNIRLVLDNKIKLSDLYTQTTRDLVSASMGDSSVFLGPIRESLQQLSTDIKIAAGQFGDSELSGLMDAIGDSNTIPFRRANELVKRLEFVIGKTAEAEDEGIAALSKLTKLERARDLLLKTIETRLEGTALKGKYILSNAQAKLAEKEFKTAFVKKLIHRGNPKVGGTPEALVNSLAGDKVSAFTNFKRLKKALGESSAEWGMFQSYLYNSVLSDNMGRDVLGLLPQGVLKGDSLLDDLVGVGPAESGAFGKAALKMALGEDGFNQFVKLAKTQATVQAPQAEGLGKMYIQLAQGGAATTLGGLAVGSLATGQNPFLSTGLAAGSAVAIVSPPVLGKLLTSKTATKLLLEGMRLEAGTARATAIGIRLAQLLEAIDQRENENLLTADIDSQQPTTPDQSFPGIAPTVPNIQ